VDILAAINRWDSDRGKRIADYCGSEQLNLMQYQILLENTRRDLDEWPLIDVYRWIAIATIEAMTAGNDAIFQPQTQTGLYVYHLKAAKYTLEQGALALPAAQQASLATCLDLLITQISSFLATVQGILK